MEFQGIERRTVVQQVAEQLREAVIVAVRTSEGLPGETSLSKALTVSRPTLREALRILEAEGLVTRDSRTSSVRPDARAPGMSRPLRSALTVLTRTERTTLADIMDLRATIESRAARRAAEVATPADLRILEKALDDERTALETDGDCDEACFQFRAAMVMASHNEAFLLVMLAAREAAADLLEHAADVARAQGGGLPEAPEVISEARRRRGMEELEVGIEIYEAIRDKQVERAEALAGGSDAFYARLVALDDE